MNFKNYTIEFMNKEGTDMYDIEIQASDIEDAYNIAYEKRDKEDDRIISIVEQM